MRLPLTALLVALLGSIPAMVSCANPPPSPGARVTEVRQEPGRHNGCGPQRGGLDLTVGGNTLRVQATGRAALSALQRPDSSAAVCQLTLEFASPTREAVWLAVTVSGTEAKSVQGWLRQEIRLGNQRHRFERGEGAPTPGAASSPWEHTFHVRVEPGTKEFPFVWQARSADESQISASLQAIEWTLMERAP